ncbi:hypothetical protein GCM10010446_56820 [Streptomyces enissocaesilis]|uniref:Uncharacterized protein n=1 Tax=Streptomyces enissocaesilis TaxID=332589 RepID=A0ABN3XNF6_9ACTN
MAAAAGAAVVPRPRAVRAETRISADADRADRADLDGGAGMDGTSKSWGKGVRERSQMSRNVKLLKCKCQYV